MFANRTKQTSSKVTVEQSAIGIYESVTRHWNQSQDTRNTLTLKPVAVNSALLDSNKEGYLLVSNREGYLLVSRKEGYLLVSHKEGYLLVSHKERYLLVSHKESTSWFLTKKGICWFLTKKVCVALVTADQQARLCKSVEKRRRLIKWKRCVLELCV
ncbi:DELLA protein GAIP-like [Dorcoceras hygrometricum]|uniref:DELLA protein GAIP-like n=1 Tax=Dorcoceras hygrometricum TaxID=472368 RepID=A0A2Z7BZM1_9LAMI|nr:DELLA protein GAIP-like [Dorcoceras hygrometricum]